MTIQQVQYLEVSKNYIRPMSDEQYGYKLFCDGGSLPATCSAEMLHGWAKAWRRANPYNLDRKPFSSPELKTVEPAENRADWIGA